MAMDRLLTNFTEGGGNESIPVSNYNICGLESHLLVNKLLVTSPSWETVSQDLRWFFSLHIYGFACLFFILSFYTFFSFLNLRSIASSPPLMSTINLLLCVLGFTRSGCLFVDPYGYREVVPKVVSSVAWDVGFVFITSAFCLVQLAFIQLTQVKFGLERLMKETYLSPVIVLHFLLIVGSDVGASYRTINYLLVYSLQLFFLLYGLCLYTSFLWAGYKVKLLLNRLPSNLLARESSGANQKGIMQLAMLAPYNNLATSVAAALVPTLLGPAKLRALDETPADKGPDTNPCGLSSTQRTSSIKSENGKRPSHQVVKDVLSGDDDEPSSTVPEVYVRPPTPTPSMANLPSIVVSSPSRRSSLASRRGSDISCRNSRRASECSVRFVNDEDSVATIPEVCPEVQIEGAETVQEPGSPSQRTAPTSTLTDKPPEGILRRNSDCSVSSTGSNRDLRRCSDFGGHEKVRSQFATKLRRNSDFGNRVPRRAPETESSTSKLARILDVSPVGSRRNSDLGGLVPTKAVESRRNSDVSCRSSERRSSDLPFLRQQQGSIRRASDVSIRTSAKSPDTDKLSDIKSESDSEPPDNSGNEKAALMNGAKPDEAATSRTRKKNLSWKNDKVKDDAEDISAETSLLPDVQQATAAAAGRVTSADLTLHSILNHIAYVNRTKSGTPLQIPEASTAAARRAQIKRVLNMTYATALLGIALCLADISRIFGPYGLNADSIKYGTKPSASQFPKPWPWIIYQTFCRFLELAMGCAMASITKQPSASPRHQYLNNYQSPYHLRMKQRDNLYI